MLDDTANLKLPLQPVVGIVRLVDGAHDASMGLLQRYDAKDLSSKSRPPGARQPLGGVEQYKRVGGAVFLWINLARRDRAS